MGSLKRIVGPVKLQILEIFTGCHPHFVWENTQNELTRHIPVFLFHTVRPDEFEEKLKFLSDNGYTTVSADDAGRIISGEDFVRPRSVMLTFDDGRKSLWSVAFPLLQKYGFKATAFINPGQVSPEYCMSPRLGDPGLNDTLNAWIEQCDTSETPVISWQEARIMQETGVVDMQCHMDTHLRVPVKPVIETFLNPGMIERYYFKFEIPLMPGVPPGKEGCWNQLGAPVYTSSPGHMDRPMYIEDSALRRECVNYVARHGGGEFFLNRHWKGKLRDIVKQFKKNHGSTGKYESAGDMRKRIFDNAARAKEKIESQLQGKPVRHLSFPWGRGCGLAVRLLKEAGYLSAYWRIIPRKPLNRAGDNPFFLVRLKHDFIWRLPGKGRKSLPEIFGYKLARRLAGNIDY